MSDLRKTLTVLHHGLAQGLHIGAQLYATIDSQPVADIALGHARLAADSPDHADVPMRPDTLMLWLSAAKPITAAAILMLWQRRLLQLEDTVAQHIPEFAANGKETITIRHLLTHTAGIRGLDSSYPVSTWDETLARIYTMHLERHWVPGLKAGYHTHTTWYILGELIRRLTGTPCDQWLRHNIFEPLAMHDTWLAMPPAQYHAYGPRIGYLYDTAEPPPAPPKPLHSYDSQLAASRPRPSASCRGPIRELARFYEMLRHGGTLDGATLLHPDTVAAMTSRQRVGMRDVTFQNTLDWGLGIILNSAHYGHAILYQFGNDASPETYGHGGSQSSTAFCDPRRNLVVALVFNGCPGEGAHDKRLRATLHALYQDLRLVQ